MQGCLMRPIACLRKRNNARPNWVSLTAYRKDSLPSLISRRSMTLLATRSVMCSIRRELPFPTMIANAITSAIHIICLKEKEYTTMASNWGKDLLLISYRPVKLYSLTKKQLNDTKSWVLCLSPRKPRTQRDDGWVSL